MVAITGTLIVQIVVFLVTIWLLKRLGWAWLVGQIDERRKRIAEGIAAGEEGRRALAEAESQAAKAIEEARARATEIIDNANRRAREVVDAARVEAEGERGRELERARAEIEQAARQARENLRGDFARISAAAAGRILNEELDPAKHAALVDEFAEKLFHG
ncbi:MAG TPA: F0F1 ATP synthase subunit B [Gammaproteobacteria bacterium]|nr:F0F1 ATP synthase subunit B [Gammaproteobacteria bacterium]